MGYSIRQRIRCKPTFPCKLWKLQSGLLDKHQGAWGIGQCYNLDPPLDWVITLLQIAPPTSLRPSPWMLI